MKKTWILLCCAFIILACKKEPTQSIKPEPTCLEEHIYLDLNAAGDIVSLEKGSGRWNFEALASDVMYTRYFDTNKTGNNQRIIHKKWTYFQQSKPQYQIDSSFFYNSFGGLDDIEVLRRDYYYDGNGLLDSAQSCNASDSSKSYCWYGQFSFDAQENLINYINYTNYITFGFPRYELSYSSVPNWFSNQRIPDALALEMSLSKHLPQEKTWSEGNPDRSYRISYSYDLDSVGRISAQMADFYVDGNLDYCWTTYYHYRQL